MSEKFVLNETAYFGRGAREELAGEIKRRGFNETQKTYCTYALRVDSWYLLNGNGVYKT